MQIGFGYFKSFHNLNHISVLFVFFFDVYLKKEHRALNLAEDEHDDRVNWQILVEVVVVLQIGLKLQSFLNLNTKYQLISQIVEITLKGM